MQPASAADAVSPEHIGNSLEHPLALLRQRLISLHGTSISTRVLTLALLAQVLVVGVCFVTPPLGLMPINVGITASGALTQVPLPVFLVITASSILAWSCLITASLLMAGVMRFVLVTLVTGILGASPFIHLISLVQVQTPRLWFPVSLHAAQVLMLAVVWVWALRTPAPQERPAPSSHLGRMLGRSLGLLSAYYGLDYLAFHSTPAITSPADLSASSLSIQFHYLPIILAVIVYWGSTDFIEWGEVVARTIVHAVQRPGAPWLFYVVIGGASAYVLIDVLVRLGVVGLLPSLAVGVLLIALTAGVVRLARVDETWPSQVPIGAQLAGAVFLFLFVQVAAAMVAALASWAQLPAAAMNPTYTVLSVTLALLTLAAGLWLIARGRLHQRGTTRATGLFLTLMALLVIALSTPQLQNVFGLPVVRTAQPNVADFEVLVPVGILGALVWLAARRRLTPQTRGLFAAAFVLLVDLKVIAWYFLLLLPNLAALSHVSVVFAAVFFLGAILWDFLLSGDQVTNQGSRAFPRDTRLLLYIGYTLVATSTFLYFVSQRVAGTSQVVPLSGTGAPLAVIGAEGLGLPLLAYTFIRACVRWRARQSTADLRSEVAIGARSPHYSRSQGGEEHVE